MDFADSSCEREKIWLIRSCMMYFCSIFHLPWGLQPSFLPLLLLLGFGIRLRWALRLVMSGTFWPSQSRDERYCISSDYQSHIVPALILGKFCFRRVIHTKFDAPFGPSQATAGDALNNNSLHSFLLQSCPSTISSRDNLSSYTEATETSFSRLATKALRRLFL